MKTEKKIEATIVIPNKTEKKEIDKIIEDVKNEKFDPKKYNPMIGGKSVKNE